MITPGLFVRADVEESQRASVPKLFSGSAVSMQLVHEMKPERLIGLFVTNILGKNSDCWVSVPLRSAWEDTASTRPALVAIIAGDNATDKHDRYVARAQMAQILHKTLIMLVKHHYHSQGWAYDRKLSDADADVMMDARLFAYGIFHSNTECTVCSNFPRLEKRADGEWQWIFDNREWMSQKFEIPLQHYQRIRLLNAMLAVEQHMYELNQVLCSV
ncbi:hypothetical protein B0H21DRAFT_696152 [Amylocystis lapponica]|nr:hypothetical protein B0H21DRAFT_696152 [Amylocystis lapponica]